MSTVASNFVKKHRRAGGFAQAVLLYLADCMNNETGLCCPSRESIAEFFSADDEPCTVKRVERALARLRKLGFITSSREPYRKETAQGVQGGWHNVYQICGLDEYVSHKTYVTPKTDVTPILERGSPHFGSGVAPTVSEGSPHGGGTKQKRNRRETEEETEVCSDAQIADAPPPPTDEEIAAMCAQSEPADLFNGAVEMVGQPPEEKPKRKRAPLVTLPEKLPDDWRELAKEKRPEIDPDALLRKMRVKLGPLVKKTLSNWKRTFLNWLAREQYYPAPHWQQRRDNRPLQREDMTYTDDF